MSLGKPENLIFGDWVNPVTWCNFNLLSKLNLSNFSILGNNPSVTEIVSPVI